MNNEFMEEVFEFISDSAKAQSVIDHVTAHPENDPDIIITACMAIIHSICSVKENPREAIEKICQELTDVTP